MKATVFRAVSVGVLAGVATFLALGPSAGYGSQIWAVFLAWASFFHLGGGFAGLRKTIVQNLFGVAMGIIALVFATQQPATLAVGYAVWAAFGVALTVSVLVLASKFALLSDVPASLLGYVAALVVALPDFRLDKILAPSVENPLVGLIASLICGALLAFAAESVTDALRARAERANSPANA